MNEKKFVVALNTKNQKKEAPASTQKPFCQFARNILRAIFFCKLQCCTAKCVLI